MPPEVKAAIDQAIRTLRRTKFVLDPILPPETSRAHSIAGSAIKRHGKIIELALATALKRLNNLEVWDEPKFYVQQAADHICGDFEHAAWQNSSLPYLPNVGRHVQLDLVVYYKEAQRLSSYELKRGNSYNDAGKKRQIIRDLACVQLLLQDYGKQRGLLVQNAEAHFISFYGRSTIPAPWALTRSDIDAHFGASVLADVEEANAYFREQVILLCAEPIQLELVLA